MRGHRLDHGAEERVDPRAGRARPAAAGPVRRAQPARDHLAGLSRRAAGGVPQSAAGQAARAQARGAARGHRGEPASKIKARVDAGRLSGPGRDRRAGGQGRQPVQGRQALRAGHRRRQLHLRAQARGASPPRRRWTASTSSAPRSTPTQHGRGRLRAQLQGAGQCGAGVPLAQDGGPEGAPDPPPHWPIGCARTSCCACSRTTSSGTCARPGAS